MNMSLLAVVLAVFGSSILAVESLTAKTNVLVTGGAGRTGQLVFTKLLASDKWNPIAVVRTEKSMKKLIKKTKCESANVICSDLLDEAKLTADFKAANAEKLILCTSAVPKIKVRSIIKTLLFKLIRRQGGRPEFRFIANGDPYHVDFLGASNQFKAAQEASLDQVVVVGSMGGTQPENFLNSIGKIEGEERSGNILLWKRAAEKKLIELCKEGKPTDSSGMTSSSSKRMTYTIVHPGGLIDKPGGERQIVLGVNDELLKEEVRNIPRGDVAEVCVQSLDNPDAQDRAIDIIARAPESGDPTTDWAAFFAQKGTYVYD